MAGSRFFDFPDTVNEVSARLVAGGVVAMCLSILLLGQRWVLIPLAAGFLARVASGPKFSPLGRLVTEVITPRLPIRPRIVAGAPKQFAQGIGATLSVSALVVWAASGPSSVVVGLVGAIACAASLEAFLGYCLGCKMFALLVRWGIASEADCVECSNISLRNTAPINS
jgi:hypothetical protein